MASKTILVSDLTGKEVVHAVRVVLMYEDGSRVELDANADEIVGLAQQGRRVATRGRPKKKREPKQQQPEPVVEA